ncbi:hypothetical protein KC345_g15 [Hortaea werneckii]|nr:hypothetical protein KC345_g15 [Hortaea werneckii]
MNICQSLYRYSFSRAWLSQASLGMSVVDTRRERGLRDVNLTSMHAVAPFSRWNQRNRILSVGDATPAKRTLIMIVVVL